MEIDEELPRDGWKSVTLPASLIEDVDTLIKNDSSHWKSRADLVTYAVRRLLETIQNSTTEPKN